MLTQLRIICEIGAGGVAGTSAGTREADGLGRRRIPLAEILRGRPEIIIEHRGEDYRLRLTSKGKLLLTK